MRVLVLTICVFFKNTATTVTFTYCLTLSLHDSLPSFFAIALYRERRMRVHRQRAFTDALTALPNRAAFNAALGALDCGTPGDWALFIIDLDNLKVVNDTFGHYAGDCLLKVAGHRIAAGVAHHDTFRICRHAFAALLQFTGPPH